ncbi:prolyl-tRNA synthetase [Peptoclostridium litorale DSM 5388]|uniref:Proline--tRNA ligase n=1 Tax=Peptoclostridium litorale DSM 5388 TaxID=1121324 RepID=A0A069RDM6_PEPLI|nr:proline--tRNA ligase [Peptoclostridium litorale]KDR94330.1 proline--tRNA ligase 2 [Peptoclostridium litorale DSM 5388]SIO29118.1 prolyl-tRNA synthetase [Peptoclostridium litorale DSM 5388]
MAKKEKQFVEEITPMEVDFARWYTDVITKTDLVDYSPVKGFMVIKPYGYALWEGIQEYADKRFKETGHKNCYFPLLIPESLLKKEEEHVEGFAPEVAWVTHGGSEELGERLCVRPTSETIICSMYAKWLNSYRDLPYLYNQWCSVVRWEKSTRPFLRTSEFLWQEGHTLHETYEEANEETLQMLGIYKELCEELLAIPVVCGRKSDKEKFAGAEATYTIEALMHDGKALQSGTSHFLGQHFTKAFEIQFTDREGGLSYPYHTSWGISTRLIGGLIMVHSDNRGLVLPPRIAPIQVAIVPIASHKGNVMEVVEGIYSDIKAAGIKVELDDRANYSPGWKFNEWEMKGVPVRLEIGPRDIENGQVTIFRRDTLEKTQVPMENLAKTVEDLLEDIQKSLFEKALKMREEKTSVAFDMDGLKKSLSENPGFVKAMWCGDQECELKIKEETGATIRCMPFEQENLSDKCICCGKKAEKMVYLAKAY